MDAPFNPRRDACFYISGDVQVHPSAAIAAGVFLQADADSRLVIGPNVSIGSGALLHAQGGVLSLATRVTLGTGVLIMGRGRIGAGACIGPRATLLSQVVVEPEQMIEAGSLVGEAQLFFEPTPANEASSQTRFETAAFEVEISSASAAKLDPPHASENGAARGAPNPTQSARPTQVYGRVVVERLMRMMSSPQPLDGDQRPTDSPPRQ
ncbi:MAG: hypothetical protein ACFB4J_17195 [Elainellaceae cyanobacterium]